MTEKEQLEDVLDNAIRHAWEKPTEQYINAFEAVIKIYESRGFDGTYYKITANEMRKKLLGADSPT